MRDWDSRSLVLRHQLCAVFALVKMSESVGTFLVMVTQIGITTTKNRCLRQKDQHQNDERARIIARTDDNDKGDHSRRLVNIVVGALTFLLHANLRMQRATNVIKKVTSPICIVHIIGDRDSRLSLRVLGMGTKWVIMQIWSPRLRFA